MEILFTSIFLFVCSIIIFFIIVLYWKEKVENKKIAEAYKNLEEVRTTNRIKNVNLDKYRNDKQVVLNPYKEIE
jgi:hypothetical protein